jgi:penicillin-binding protein 1A
MRRHGWLAGTAFQQASTAPLAAIPQQPPVGESDRAPHFVEYVKREAAALDELGGSDESRRKQLYTGGYTIETTLDPRALDAATDAVRQNLGAPGDPTAAIVSVQPGDGAIKVLFGGLDVSRKFDVASQGRRQPGSSFKPYVYLAMLEGGIDPRSQLDAGSPKTLPCGGEQWPVRNFEGEGAGMVTVDDAMAHSVNTVFAQLMVEVGPHAVQQVAEKAGIAADEVTPPRCAMALGGLRRGVSPLEQAAAFATFAAKGVYALPYSIVRIRDRAGHVVYQHGVKTTPAIPEKEAGVLTTALEGVVSQGTGTAAAMGRPLAGKTGTTENFGNAWFIGYVPQLATAVWVGNPDGDVPMTSVHGIAVTGGTFPARIFSRYMKAAMTGAPVQNLYTASPDELSLHMLNATTTSSTSTTSSSTTTTTTAAPADAPLPPEPGPPAAATPTTRPQPRPGTTTTTTTRPPKSTTTTAAAAGGTAPAGQPP